MDLIIQVSDIGAIWISPLSYYIWEASVMGGDSHYFTIFATLEVLLISLLLIEHEFTSNKLHPLWLIYGGSH